MHPELENDEDWALIEDDEDVKAGSGARPWRVLIVDDEADIHAVTRMALQGIEFKGRPLELISAHSGIEAFDLLRRESDIALILLDVVMETEDAGLRLVRRIRDELANPLVRIVLRTGQPGQAPEEKVIVEFDINDYKAKTELTKQKLFTTVIASLRAYEGLVSIENSNIGLRKILDGAGNLYQQRSLKEFASGVLDQIGALLNIGTDGVLCLSESSPASEAPEVPTIIAATGSCAELAALEHLPANHPWAGLVAQALREKRNLFEHPVDVLYVPTSAGKGFAIVVTPPWPLSELQRNLLGVFCDRIAAAFDNLHMVELLQKAKEATVIALADLAESRDADTGGHVQRVCRLTEAITHELHTHGQLPADLPAQFIEQVGLASMLHDIGKVATPDAVLLKPGRLTPEEREIMERHVNIGEAVLQHAAAMVDGENYLTIGAQIAGGHHEHFDGNGYPRRLSGSAIPIAARIVAVVDVFDALLHRRPYKEAWPLPEVLTYLRERAGSQFDPEVVEALARFVDRDQPDWLIGEEP